MEVDMTTLPVVTNQSHPVILSEAKNLTPGDERILAYITRLAQITIAQGEQINTLTGKLDTVTALLQQMASVTPAAPDFVRPIDEFKSFDFSIIGARAVAVDAYGPTQVEWGGYIWTRRNPVNKFDPAIWYSRPCGKDEAGHNKYLRLITFKKLASAEPIRR